MGVGERGKGLNMLHNKALNNSRKFSAITLWLSQCFHFRQEFTAACLGVHPSGPWRCSRKEREVQLRISQEWQVHCDCTPGVQESSKHSRAWHCTHGKGKPPAPGEGDVHSQPGMQETPSGKAQLVLSLGCHLCATLMLCQQKLGSCMLTLGTIYGFRENITEGNTELGSCMSAEIPARGNCFHSHFWVCKQVLILL